MWANECQQQLEAQVIASNREATAQAGQEFTMYHQNYIHPELIVSTKDVSRAERQEDKHTVWQT